MSAKKPKLWISNKHTNHISFRRLSGYESRYPSTFEISRRIHPSWEEARAAVVADRRAELSKAEAEVKRARGALVRAESLLRPLEPKP